MVSAESSRVRLRRTLLDGKQNVVQARRFYPDAPLVQFLQATVFRTSDLHRALVVRWSLFFEAAMSTAADTPRNSRTRFQLLFALLLVFLLAVLALLWQGCYRGIETRKIRKSYLTPRDLALEFDRDGILNYCRTKLNRATYAGIFRGAHGALWGGEANDWDRVILAATALKELGVEAQIVPGHPPRLAYRDRAWVTTCLDTNASSEASPEPPRGSVTIDQLAAERPGLFHEIRPALRLESADGAQRLFQAASAELLANWVYRPLVLSVVGGPGEERYTLRDGDREILASGPLEGVRRASLELTWRFEDRTTTWKRELFDRANEAKDIPGHDRPREGDRYALVLAAGPLVPEVISTRQHMLDVPEHTPVTDKVSRELILLGSAYLVASDKRSGPLAELTGVHVAWTIPRLVIAASEIPDRLPSKPDPGGRPVGLSLDVLADEVHVDGDATREYHNARSISTELAETQVVFDGSGLPVVSASTVFARHKVTAPETPERRIAVIAAEARRLLDQEPIGTALALKPLPPRGSGKATVAGAPPLTIVRTREGLVLSPANQGGAQDNRKVWDYFGLSPAKPINQQDLPQLANLTEVLLARLCAEPLGYGPAYQLGFEERRPLPLHPLPLAAGSILIYEARLGDISHRIAVRVELGGGVPGGTWFELDSERAGRIDNGAWPEALGRDAAGPNIRAYLAPPSLPSGESIRYKFRMGKVDRAASDRVADDQTSPGEVDAKTVTLPDGALATLLDSSGFPLILKWTRGDAYLALVEVSPVLTGRILDADTGRPVIGAMLTCLDRHELKSSAASDGSFALPVPPPLFRRLVLVLDRSGSMYLGTDPETDRTLVNNPQVGRSAAPEQELEKIGLLLPPQQRRMGLLHKAVHDLLKRVPADFQVALWSYPSPDIEDRHRQCDPANTKVELSFTRDRATIAQYLEKIQPIFKGTPTTGAVKAILEHVQKFPLSRDAVFVLMSDGDNSCRDQSAAEAYQTGEGETKPVIHTVNFVAPQQEEQREEQTGGHQAKRANQLQQLAQASGGNYYDARTGKELASVFDEIGKKVASIRVRVSAPGYEPVDVVIPVTELGMHQEIAISRPQQAGFLNIRRDNITELDRCHALSPKARKMIEERVATGAWSVKIPTARVGIGDITAYGWFETELDSGRIIGRTEDGLHGAVAISSRWPQYNPEAEKTVDSATKQAKNAAANKARQIAAGQPFVVWHQGIVAYTTGSVESALRWYRQPGFLSASRDDFNRYIQANALEFSSRWWEGIGKKFAGDPTADNYWSGVCLNHLLQSQALEQPDAGCECYRAWARNLCLRFQETLIDALNSLAGMAADEILTELNPEVDKFRNRWKAFVNFVDQQALMKLRPEERQKALEELDGAEGQIIKRGRDLVAKAIGRESGELLKQRPTCPEFDPPNAAGHPSQSTNQTLELCWPQRTAQK